MGTTSGPKSGRGLTCQLPFSDWKELKKRSSQPCQVCGKRWKNTPSSQTPLLLCPPQAYKGNVLGRWRCTMFSSFNILSKPLNFEDYCERSTLKRICRLKFVYIKNLLVCMAAEISEHSGFHGNSINRWRHFNTSVHICMFPDGAQLVSGDAVKNYVFTIAAIISSWKKGGGRAKKWWALDHPYKKNMTIS